jgi:hypothetical protein
VFEAFFAEVVDLQRQLPTLDRSGLTSLTTGLAKVRGALAALEAGASGSLADLDDDGPSPSATIRSSTKCSQREADRRARRGTALAQMPRTRAALAEGRITEEHADVLVRAADSTSPTEVEHSDLIQNAELRPADLAARDAREWTRRRESDRTKQDRHIRQRDSRRLAIFEGDCGMIVVHGEFDPVVGQAIRVSVEAEANRMFTADGGREAAQKVRTRDQRRADAFEALVTKSGSGGSANSRPRNQLIIVAETGVIDGTDPQGRCEIPGLGPIPKSELERLACNADLFGLLFSGDGEPLWHGRGHRTATDPQMRGLIARDGGCIGCGKGPQYCEAHHIVHWAPPARGPTDIDNMVLLCTHEHRLVHDHGWRVVRGGDGKFRLEPPEASQ